MDNKIIWCLKQKRGVKIVEPNENLYKAYILKAREALEAMNVNSERKILSWAVSASYYARYFAVYALLSKIGIKSEIHKILNSENIDYRIITPTPIDKDPIKEYLYTLRLSE